METVAQAPLRARIGGYVALTKPRIIELLLITTVPTMVVAEQGLPSLWLIVATVLGGTFAAGGANAAAYRAALEITAAAGNRYLPFFTDDRFKVVAGHEIRINVLFPVKRIDDVLVVIVELWWEVLGQQRSWNRSAFD